MIKSFLYVASTAILVGWFYGRQAEKENQANYVVNPGQINEASPPCLQMYYNIEKYAEEYGIPREYAFGIAHIETGYRGPFHWEYDPAQTSYAGAVGPMQIIPKYAHPYIEGKFTTSELKNNVEMNVKASMRILQDLRRRYGSWILAFGAYNTGSPCINGYATKVASYRPDY